MAIAFNLDVNKAGSLIVGLPGWADNDGWDIQAAAGTSSTQQKRVMLQALLAERFKLTFHRETRQIAVFGLALSNQARLSRRSPSCSATGRAGACLVAFCPAIAVRRGPAGGA